jgi:hypothetical protein
MSWLLTRVSQICRFRYKAASRSVRGWPSVANFEYETTTTVAAHRNDDPPAGLGTVRAGYDDADVLFTDFDRGGITPLLCPSCKLYSGYQRHGGDEQ